LLKLRAKFPQLTVSLREGYQAELETLLQADELDLAITLIEKKVPSGIHSTALLELPLVCWWKRAAALRRPPALGTGPDDGAADLPAARRNHLQELSTGLSRLKVDWFPGIEVSSIDLIEIYVGERLWGRIVRPCSQSAASSEYSLVPLPGFAPVAIARFGEVKRQFCCRHFSTKFVAAKHLAARKSRSEHRLNQYPVIFYQFGICP